MGNSRAVLCATCAYGMGVDKADVRTVIHRDCAPSVEAYLQESGRAGRDGAQSKAVLLWGPDDESSLRRAKTDADRVRLTGLLDYARNVTQCRRHALLHMLDYNAHGESPETMCCDVCVSDGHGEKQASALLREETTIWHFFQKNKRRYTINEAAKVLANVTQFHWSEEEAKQVILYLLKQGRLKKTNKLLWENSLTTATQQS